MFYPDNNCKSYWDLLVTIILIFTCTLIPYRISFIEHEDTNWKIALGLIDVLFFIDIIFNFNTAFLDENFKLITSRKVIAKDYLKGWFIIDLTAIIPFDWMF